jgi:hypothetical protein
MAFANGAPLIGATNEKPRLVEQPGFSSVYLRDLILPNRDISEIACGDEIQPNTAFGDDADSLSNRLVFTFLRLPVRGYRVYPRLEDIRSI